MARFVHSGAPQIIAIQVKILSSLAWEGAGEDVAAVVDVDGRWKGDGGAGGATLRAGGVGVGDGCGEGAVSQ